MKIKNWLLIDVGNSSISCAFYIDRKITDLNTGDRKNYKSLIAPYLKNGACSAIVSSVVPEMNDELVSLLGQDTVFVSSDNVPKISVNMEVSEQVGADRLVNALAAFQIYQRNCLVVDAGTAVTFCGVSAEGTYNGGAIFPGMKIASHALHDHTAKLPLIWVTPVTSLFGKNTEEAIQIGLYHGYRHLINGMIKDYRRDEPGLFVVGAGHGLAVVKDHLDLDAYDPDLVLKGLAICVDDMVGA